MSMNGKMEEHDEDVLRMARMSVLVMRMMVERTVSVAVWMQSFVAVVCRYYMYRSSCSTVRVASGE